MQRHGHVQLQLDGLCELLLGAAILPLPPDQVGRQTNDGQRQRRFEQMLIRRREEIHHSGYAPDEARSGRARKERSQLSIRQAGG